MADDKISDVSGAANIWLGSKQNTRQTILYVPASGVAGSGSADKPGLLFLEAVDSSGDIQKGLYFWADSGDNFHVSATYPTDEDAAGSVFAASGATTELDNLGTVACSESLISDTKNTDDLGSAALFWKDLYLGGDIYIQEAVASNYDYKITFETPSNNSVLSVPYPGTAADIMLDAGATDNAISYTKGTASITLAEGNTDIIIGAAGQLQIGTGTVKFNGAAAMDVATDKVVNIDQNLTVDTTAVTLDQDLQITASVEFNSITDGTATLTGGALSGVSTLGTTDHISIVGDSKRLYLGASSPSDSYIEHVAAGDMTFHDAVAGTMTLSELYAGTQLNPVVTGNLSIPDGSLVLTETTNATSVSITNNTQTTTGNLLLLSSGSLTSATALLIDTDAGAAGLFIDCDNTGSKFSVDNDYGQVIIAGNASTDVLTLAAGDIKVTNGDLYLTEGIIDADLAADQQMLKIYRHHNSTCAAAVALIEESYDGAQNIALQVTSAETGAYDTMAISHAGTEAGLIITNSNVSGAALELVAADAAVVPALIVDGTTGTNGYSGVAAHGLVEIKQDGTAALAAANTSLLYLDFDGTYDTTGEGACLIVDDDATVDGVNFAVYMNSLAANVLKLETQATDMTALLIEPKASATVAGLIVDGDANGYLGADTHGMVHLKNNIAGGNANATMLLIDKSAAIAEINTARGTCLRIMEDMNVAASGVAYAVYIHSDNNAAMYIEKGAVKIGGAVTCDTTLGVTGATTFALGQQSDAVALTASVGGQAITAGTTFINVTSTNADHIIKLPAPILGNVIFLKANSTTNFELGVNATTNYLNNVQCSGGEEMICDDEHTVVAICTKSGSTGTWVTFSVTKTGVVTDGGAVN